MIPEIIEHDYGVATSVEKLDVFHAGIPHECTFRTPANIG